MGASIEAVTSSSSVFSEHPVDVSPTVAFYSLGCRTNQLESSALADMFKQHGWQVRPFHLPADLYVINTCTVTHGADSESRRIIRKARRLNPKAQIAVTGCYVQVAPKDIASIEGVSYVIGNNYKQDILQIIEAQRLQDTQSPVNLFESGPLMMVSEIDKSRMMMGASSSAINRTRASLKIQDGCDYLCTYCIIPRARGLSRSLTVDQVVTQFHQLLEQGFKEIVLTGINIGQYLDPNQPVDLAGLVETLIDIPGEFRIRLSSLDPFEIEPNLLDIMKDSSKLCPYIHLSAQSAQDDILKRMARRHRVRDLYEMFERLGERLSDVCVASDIIVGFPGETPNKFDQTVQVLRELPFSYFHVFAYSKRADTAAVDFPDHVPESEKKRRSEQLIQLSQDKNWAYRQRFMGYTCDVLVEQSGRQGLSPHFITVDFNGMTYPQNSLIPVKITDVTFDRTVGILDCE